MESQIGTLLTAILSGGSSGVIAILVVVLAGAAWLLRQQYNDLKAREEQHDADMRDERTKFDGLQKEYRDTLAGLYQRAQDGVTSTSQAIASLRDVLSEIRNKLDK